jgi:hypothetical protein
MKDLRALLIDCRIELRKLVRDFQKTELCERLDLAIQAAANANAAPSPAAGEPLNPALPGAAPERPQAVSQVALAWQTAARDIKFSDPAAYTRMGEKVMRLLSVKTLVDPATEIIQLEQQLASQAAAQAEQDAQHKATAAERDALLDALARAVPKVQDGADRMAVALARLAWLKAEAEKAGKGPAPAQARAPEPQDTIPSNELLAAAAAGAATFTSSQREWCVGEAMVLTGFQFTPVELLQKGDTHLAKLIQMARLGR